MVAGKSWSQTSGETLQPRIKTLDKRPIRSHHCDVLGDLNMLSFDNYIALSYINITDKCLHGQAPQALCDLIQAMQAAGRSTRGAAAGNFRYPTAKPPLASLSILS